MNKYFLIILCLLLSLSVSGQSSPDFYYTGAYRQVDFNRDAFFTEDFHDYYFGMTDCNWLRNSGIIVNGECNIYQFDRHRYGDLYPDSVGFVREIILVKVKDGFIEESYFIPCDCKELPVTAFFMVSHQRVPFKKRISIKRLKFEKLDKNSTIGVEYFGKMRSLMFPSFSYHYPKSLDPKSDDFPWSPQD